MYTMTTRTPRPGYSRGEVVLVAFPHSNLQTAGLRPGLVIQADNLRTGLPQIIIAMVTSNLARAGHPSRVSVLRNSPAGLRSGLLADSVVMTDNIATVLESAITRVIGSMDMLEIDSALRHTLSL